MDVKEFDACTADEIQTIFRRQHIVVTGLPLAEHGFDQAGLHALSGKMDERVFTIQGPSHHFIYFEGLIILEYRLVQTSH